MCDVTTVSLTTNLPRLLEAAMAARARRLSLNESFTGTPAATGPLAARARRKVFATAGRPDADAERRCEQRVLQRATSQILPLCRLIPWLVGPYRVTVGVGLRGLAAGGAGAAGGGA